MPAATLIFACAILAQNSPKLSTYKSLINIYPAYWLPIFSPKIIRFLPQAALFNYLYGNRRMRKQALKLVLINRYMFYIAQKCFRFAFY